MNNKPFAEIDSERVHEELILIFTFQQERCIRRILAQPGRVVSVAYKLDDGTIRFDDYEEAIDALSIIDSEANYNDDDDLDAILEAASRPLLYWRFLGIWERFQTGKKFF